MKRSILAVVAFLLGGLLGAGMLWAAIGRFEVLPAPKPAREISTPAPPAIHCFEGHGHESHVVELSPGVWTASMWFYDYYPAYFSKANVMRWNLEDRSPREWDVTPRVLDVAVSLTSDAGRRETLVDRITPPPPMGWPAFSLDYRVDRRSKGPYGVVLINTEGTVYASGFEAQKVLRLDDGIYTISIATPREWGVTLHNRPLDEFPESACE